MGVFYLNNLPKEKRIQMIAEFYDVIDFLRDRKETRLFLKDLLTGDEIASLMRRIEIAVLLKAGFSREKIKEILKTSNDKINKVQKVLTSEERGAGYNLIIERLLNKRKERIKRIKKTRRDQSLSKRIKRNHYGIFLLENLLDDVFDNLKNEEKKQKDVLLFTPSFIDQSFKIKNKGIKKKKKATSKTRRKPTDRSVGLR